MSLTQTQPVNLRGGYFGSFSVALGPNDDVIVAGTRDEGSKFDPTDAHTALTITGPSGNVLSIDATSVVRGTHAEGTVTLSRGNHSRTLNGSADINGHVITIGLDTTASHAGIDWTVAVDTTANAESVTVTNESAGTTHTVNVSGLVDVFQAYL